MPVFCFYSIFFESAVIKILGSSFQLSEEFNFGDKHEYNLIWSDRSGSSGFCLVHFVNDIVVYKSQNGLR